jgi:DNA-binding response OmpR family regulator
MRCTRRRLAAFARSEDRTRALPSGFEMHLAKPVDPGELVASVASLVRRSAKGR